MVNLANKTSKHDGEYPSQVEAEVVRVSKKTSLALDLIKIYGTYPSKGEIVTRMLLHLAKVAGIDKNENFDQAQILKMVEVLKSE
jgi:hypothetical protein